jgi:hypothetical protein
VLKVFALAASIVAWLQANQRKNALIPQVPKFNTGKKMNRNKTYMVATYSAAIAPFLFLRFVTNLAICIYRPLADAQIFREILLYICPW